MSTSTLILLEVAITCHLTWLSPAKPTEERGAYATRSWRPSAQTPDIQSHWGNRVYEGETIRRGCIIISRGNQQCLAESLFGGRQGSAGTHRHGETSPRNSGEPWQPASGSLSASPLSSRPAKSLTGGSAHTHRLPVGGAAVQGSMQYSELPQGSHFVHRFWG